jgi:hypothetical protein
LAEDQLTLAAIRELVFAPGLRCSRDGPLANALSWTADSHHVRSVERISSLTSRELI